MADLFWLDLGVKMAMTAGIVVAASMVVERAGPFVGALVAALPTAAGAAYILLALEHTPQFISDSAVGTVAANAVVALFALTYATLAQRHSLLVSLGDAVLVWITGALLLQQINWTAPRAVALNVMVFAVTLTLSRKLRTDEVPAVPAALRRRDLAVRALMVAVFVALVTTASHRIGSFASGLFAAFPVAMGSFIAILHPRVGGRATASVCAHVQWPMIGLGLGFLAVHYLAVPFGVWWAYGVGLGIGISWNAMLWILRTRRRRPVRTTSPMRQIKDSPDGLALPDLDRGG